MGKDKKKHKKKTKEHKKRHKKISRRKSSSSSSSDDGSSDEWVESEVAPPAAMSDTSSQREEKDAVSELDEWASNPVLLACTSRDQLRQGKEKKKDEHDKYMLDKLGRTDRELNPYWRDGGSGLPEEAPATVESLRQSHTTVGDQGAAWLRKALQRAKEQAQESGRPLAEVVAERWGSLEKLENMIVAAEERDKNKKLGLPYGSRYSKRDEYRNNRYNVDQGHRYQCDREHKTHREMDTKKSFSKPPCSSEDSSDNEIRYKSKKESERNNDKDQSSKDVYRRKNSKSEKTDRRFKRMKESSCSSDDSSDGRGNKSNKQKSDKDKSVKKFSKPRSSSSSSVESERNTSKKYKEDKLDRGMKYKSARRGFSKPANSSSDEDEKRYRSRKNDKFGDDKDRDSRKKFVKPSHDSEEDDYKLKSHERRSQNYKSFSSSGGGWRKNKPSEKKDEECKPEKKNEASEEDIISENEEDNKATIQEAEPILTDKELNELAAKLVKAEILGNQELADELKAKLNKAREAKANAPKGMEDKEVVILTHTDSKGFTRPVSSSGLSEPSGGRRKGRKVETHAGGKRMRYFADDDKYSLQEMFQREKLNTVEDSNEVFAKLASKGIGRDDSARDMEDVFEETARVDEGEGRQKSRELQKAREQSRRTARTLENCQWCLDSQQMLKHLIVAIGTSCYLCVPPHQSLTEHHCLIVPRAHTPCATQLDEDVWAEMQDFRKAVVKMFLSQDEDVVFFESARRLNQFPHMVLNCVPVPKETGDMAPIYFKKAIQECEQEWSNNKKLVELKGRDVRRAVPKGLPYFAVDFGMDSGYAHVIEDEQLFPLNFAQEIIGGMLDLDHSVWRKQRRQTFEEQSKKVIQLSKLWSPFDITKKVN